MFRFCRRLFAALLFALIAPSHALAHAPPPSPPGGELVSAVLLQLFDSEAAAQRHCPRDVVVWLNTKTGIYHEKGMRWYGNTKHGAYVCRREADAAGDRDTRNGQ